MENALLFNILLIDKKKTNSLENILKSPKRNILKENSMKSFVNIIKTTYISIIILNLNLSKEKTINFLKSLKNNYINYFIPTILVIDKPENDDDIIEFLKEGIIGFIYKPFNISLIQSKIDIYEKFFYQIKENIKEKEEALNKSKLKSNFVANISHELRTPMNSILGFSELIQNSSKEIKIKEYASNVYKNGNRLLKLINEILDISKIEEGKLEIVNNLFSIKNFNRIKDELKTLIEKKNIEFNIIYGRELPEMIYSDENKIYQILMNLVSNSLKFTEKGYINIEISKYIEKNNEHINISVKDTGIGIKEDDLKNIFNDYFQVENENCNIKGTGLGLVISKRIANLLGGDINVSSVYSKGSIFNFNFKLNKYDIELLNDINNKKDILEEKKIYFTDAKNILIVEDDESEILLLKELLREHALIFVNNGEEALLYCSKYIPDLIIMDIVMPKMNGLKAITEIRKIKGFKKVPIIACTAKVMVGDKEKILERSFNDYISKHFSLVDLKEKLSLYGISIYNKIEDIENIENNEINYDEIFKSLNKISSYKFFESSKINKELNLLIEKNKNMPSEIYELLKYIKNKDEKNYKNCLNKILNDNTLKGA